VASREEFLARIREALGHSGAGEASRPGPGAGLPPARLPDVMPPIAPGELLAKFEEELANVSGIAHRASSFEELESILKEILGGARAESVVLSRNPLLGQLELGKRLRAWGKSVEEWPAGGNPTQDAREAYRAACFSAAVGITGADWALAETGSLVVTSASEGSQLASLAPPVHVALYRRGQLVESLDDILEQFPIAKNTEDSSAGRSAVFVTGVSRTADIEQILIRGVHGPRELHAILVEESCLPAAAPGSR
jgi:L-lactate dehydrogenase complex protein LldG